MNWVIEHIDTAILFIIPGILLVGLLFIWLGKVMYPGARMAHENEPQEPREWRSANWKPLNDETKL